MRVHKERCVHTLQLVTRTIADWISWYNLKRANWALGMKTYEQSVSPRFCGLN